MVMAMWYLFSCDDISCRFFSHSDVRHANSLLHAASSMRASSACDARVLVLPLQATQRSWGTLPAAGTRTA